MSPSGGGMWAPIAMRALRQAVRATTKLLHQKLLASPPRPLANTLTNPITAAAKLQPVVVRAPTGPHARHLIHPAAWLRQSRSGRKWFTSGPKATLRRRIAHFTTSNLGTVWTRFITNRTRTLAPATFSTARSSIPASLRAPFASPLRPNLAGGTLPRTAGGYVLPGSGCTSARHFSHSPAAPAQVVQQVSQAMRAFCLSGQRARFDGVGPNGQPRYRAVKAEETALRSCGMVVGAGPGAFVDFYLGLTLTALTPSTAAKDASTTLNTPSFLPLLTADLARACTDLSTMQRDMAQLSQLGDLPVHFDPARRILRVRFPGLDAEAVEKLCGEVGVRRGVVGQEDEFTRGKDVEMALRFPFAPADLGTEWGRGVWAGEEDEDEDEEEEEEEEDDDDDDDVPAMFAPAHFLSSASPSSLGLLPHEHILLDELIYSAATPSVISLAPAAATATAHESTWAGASSSSRLGSGFEFLSSRSPSEMEMDTSPRIFRGGVSSATVTGAGDDFTGPEGIRQFLEACERARGLL